MLKQKSVKLTKDDVEVLLRCINIANVDYPSSSYYFHRMTLRIKLEKLFKIKRIS